MVGGRLAAFGPERIRVVSWDGRTGSGVALAAARLRWLYLNLPSAVSQVRAEAVLHLLPEVGRTSQPQVIVLHDVAPLVTEATWRQRLYFRTVVARAVRTATGVVADSERTSQDAVSIFGLRPDRVRVVYAGVDLERFKPVSESNARRVPYLLAVGSHAPHKRLGLLMRAFAASPLARTYDLQIVGPPSRYTPALLWLRDRLGLERSTSLAPYDTVDDLARRYAAAELYVSVSSYEGFGLPALEALACGTPVVVTDVGAARAYVGGAGILVPCDADVARIADALTEGARLRAQPSIRALARRQAERFSWDRTAVGLVDAVADLVGSG